MITKHLRKSPDIHPLRHVRVIDGDTIEAEVLLPFDTVITKRIRLKGWWADELDGPYRSCGLQAFHALKTFLEGKVLWMLSPSCRLDRYGRIVGTLVIDGKLISAKEVLGPWALDERTHKAHRDQATRQKAQNAAWPNDKPLPRPEAVNPLAEAVEAALRLSRHLSPGDVPGGGSDGPM